MRNLILLLLLISSTNVFAAESCLDVLLDSQGVIKSALSRSKTGLVPAIHTEFGEGYIVLNERTGTVTFDQNSLNGHRVENVSLKKIALELSAKSDVKSAKQIQKNIPFMYQNKQSLTWGLLANGKILAYEVSTGKTFVVSKSKLEKGVLELAPKNISVGSKVKLNIYDERTAHNARVIAIDGIYALVQYDYYSGTSAVPSLLSYHNAYSKQAKRLIPLSQLKI